MIQSVNFRQDSYGNIQRAGSLQNGRAVYRVIDSTGNEAGKLSIPAKDTDKFERAYVDIMDAAPQIQKYALENSSEKDISCRRNLSRAVVAAGGIAGAAVSIAITRKSSTLKQILAAVAGIIAGLSAGFITSLAVTAPPGTYKFAKASHIISKLDIQPVKTNS